MATVAALDECLRVAGADLLLALRVQPRASRARVDGVESGRLRLRVAAPPVEGSANRAVLDLLGEVLDVARSRLVLERGDHGRNKDVRIVGGATQRVAIRDALVEASAGKP
jgi:uncharacterized protein (TIGR00251 family)